MSKKGLPAALFEAGTRLVSRATERVLSDPRGQEALARAAGLAQRGRRRFEALQERVLSGAGIPGRRDYEELARQLARLKRKARELGEKLARDGGPDDGETR